MNSNPLQTFHDRQSFMMLDGGLATQMEQRGADLDDDLWSAKMLVEAPEMIRGVHSDFLKAGADVIATATYQASFEGFAKAGYRAEQAESLMRLGVDLAVLARESFWAKNENHTGRIRPLVAASIGPYGATLHDGSEYHGNYGLDKKDLMDFHRPRMQILAGTAADLFVFETIPSRLEAEALIELMQEFPGKQAWLSFSCRDEKHVSHGELFADCVALVEASDQIFAAGVNCTDPKYVCPLLESVADHSKPLTVYPNSGEQWNSQGNQWVGDGCATMPVQDWYDRGARLIGGCCRTTMEEITRMRSHLTRYVGRVVNEQ